MSAVRMSGGGVSLVVGGGAGVSGGSGGGAPRLSPSLPSSLRNNAGLVLTAAGELSSVPTAPLASTSSVATSTITAPSMTTTLPPVAIVSPTASTPPPAATTSTPTFNYACQPPPPSFVHQPPPSTAFLFPPQPSSSSSSSVYAMSMPPSAFQQQQQQGFAFDSCSNALKRSYSSVSADTTTPTPPLNNGILPEEIAKRRRISTIDEAIAHAAALKAAAAAATIGDPHFKFAPSGFQATITPPAFPSNSKPPLLVPPLIHSSAAEPDAPHKLPAQRKITPVTTDVPPDLVNRSPDELFEEIVEVVNAPTVVPPPAPLSTPSALSVLMNSPAFPPGFGPSFASSFAAPFTPTLPPPPPPVYTTKFKCRICEHVFPKKHTVLTHIKTHLGKKPFLCTHEGCDMAFVREHDRKRHELTHTGVRPYVCECGKQFSRHDALRRHSTYGRCPVRDPSLLEKLKNDPDAGVLSDGETVPSAEGEENKEAAKLKVKVKRSTGRRPGRPKRFEPHPPPLSETDDSQTSVLAAVVMAMVPPPPPPKKKKKRGSLYSRPVHDGDSELDEDDGERGEGKRHSLQVVEEEVMGDVQCEEGEEGPSSFLFSIPGIHTKAMVEEARRKASAATGDAAEVENNAEDVAVVSAEEDGMETSGEVEPEAESSGVSSSGSFSSGLMPLYEEIVERRHRRVPFFVERAFDEGDSSELGGTFRLKKLCDCPTSSSSSSTSSSGSKSLYVRDVLRHPNSSSSDDDDDDDDDYICAGVEGVAMPALLLTSPPVERAKTCVNVAELSRVLAKMAWPPPPPPQIAVMSDNGRRVRVDGEIAGIVAGVS
ncbi:hypothetical protein FRB99_007569 [Tulasnella sp. 403]|nr:hypothetical protein FRB99_007569 [Tulasnella sp. 403]